jgi:hypothetical protein
MKNVHRMKTGNALTTKKKKAQLPTLSNNDLVAIVGGANAGDVSSMEGERTWQKPN